MLVWLHMRRVVHFIKSLFSSKIFLYEAFLNVAIEVVFICFERCTMQFVFGNCEIANIRNGRSWRADPLVWKSLCDILAWVVPALDWFASLFSLHSSPSSSLTYIQFFSLLFDSQFVYSAVDLRSHRSMVVYTDVDVIAR